MTTFDIEVNLDDEPKAFKIAEHLKSLGSKHSYLLALFLLSVESKFPMTDTTKKMAFVDTAIKLTNEYGVSAFVSLEELYEKIAIQQVN